jgi:hypothetical protein
MKIKKRWAFLFICVLWFFLELLSEAFHIVGKDRVKFHPRTGHQGPEGE